MNLNGLAIVRNRTSALRLALENSIGRPSFVDHVDSSIRAACLGSPTIRDKMKRAFREQCRHNDGGSRGRGWSFNTWEKTLVL